MSKGLRYLGTLGGRADTTRKSCGINLILVLRYLFLGLRYLGTLCGGADTTRKSWKSNLILVLRYLFLGLRYLGTWGVGPTPPGNLGKGI